MATSVAVATGALSVAGASSNNSGAGVTPSASAVNAASSSQGAAASSSAASTAVAAAPPAMPPPHHGPTSSASLYLENALSSLSAAAQEMEERFAARKMAFKASLQERINAFRAPSQPPQPQPPQGDVAALEAMRKARVAARIAASVTYRPPMRDPEDSLAGSSTYHQGPQSSAGGGSGVGGRVEPEASLTVHEWRTSHVQRGELRRLDFTFDNSDDEDADDADADPTIGVTLDTADADGLQGDQEDRLGEEPSRNSCCVVHTLTVHKDTCDDDALARPHAHAHATIDVLASARSRSGSLAAASSNSASGSSSATVSLHIHAEADAIAADEASAATAATSAAAAAAAAQGSWLVSALDPAFIVAPVSSELQGDDVWHELHEHPVDGHLVPRAPALQCDCAVPWRSLEHLRTHHLQPASHARNVVFEGVRYAAWRGPFYCNGEPKPVLRGVLHELGFILALMEMCALFPLVDSAAGWVAAVVSIAAQLLLFGVSSQFHRRRWLLPTYNRLKRMDHSAIFMLAAGSSTPCGILLLRAAQDASLVGGGGGGGGGGTGDELHIAGVVLLCWAWGTALLGVAHSLTKRLSGKVSPFGLVWMGVSSACMVPFVSFLHSAMLPLEFGFLWAAWALYLLGVMTYSRGWFNGWWPGVGGYHEVFHLCTIVGGICTGVFNFSICTRLT